MTCAEEVATLQRELGPLVGGDGQLAFDVLNSRLIVRGALQDVNAERVVAAVKRTGMTAVPWTGESTAGRNPESSRLGRTGLAVVSAVATLAAFTWHASEVGSVAAALGSEGMGLAHEVPITARLLYSVGVLSGGWHVFPRAWHALRRLRPDMNLLMTIAVLGAAAIGEWLEAATVSFLFAVSLALESWSVGRARRAVAALMDLSPPTARLREADGSERDVAPAEVPLGAAFVVKPGERIPLDGRVLAGTSGVNQAPITGESLAVPKAPGSVVYAGTINGDGALEIECTKAASDTTLAHIIRMVAEAQTRRAPSEQWVERFARIYTPAVMALALLVLLVPPLFLGGAWADWLYRALVLLVIGCPCALVISTPVSIVAALASAAREGVLIKGGLHVETPGRLRAVALDKTGTLTEGRPRVEEVVALGGHDEAELLAIAAAMESRSEHPLAKAILDHAREKMVAPSPAQDFQILPGKGASARIGGRTYWLGSHRYLEERGGENGDVHQRLETMARIGRSVVVVGDDDHVCGLIALADGVRPEAAAAVRALREAGIEHVVMLTGDNRGTAETVARLTGVDEVHAELLPADKVKAVEALVARYGAVAMCGDGVNDAPAMARATVGIAMGAVGSDAAIETADIALMSDDLSRLPWLVAHSRRALAIIRQNIALSLAVKAGFVVLTFSGQASLWAAIAADMGASLLVIFNGLRLLAPRDATAALPPRRASPLMPA
ncbi:MAG: heavy metal translocating P-type ATPase [Vicinamibacteria bacterium]|nr:heavy metal translocating P-type ATPase [Vicinamibacteria bacterium]